MTRFQDGITAADLAALRAAGARRRWPKGASLFLEGSPASRVMLVESGRVKLSQFSSDGREDVLAIRGPGDLLGDMSAVDGGPCSATGTALEQVTALAWSPSAFVEVLEARPGLAVVLLRTMVSRLRDADRKRVEFGSRDTAGRLAGCLIDLAKEYGVAEDGAIRIALPVTQDELAGMIGASREAVAKSLRSMRDRTWVQTKRREIWLLDVDAVRHFAS